jgi:hypothetical protein
VGRFAIVDGELGRPTSYLKMPPELRRRSDDGIEALAVLRAGKLKGAIVAFAERRLRGRDHHTGWIWIGKEPMALSLAGLGSFDITDAAALPDGGLLLLERSFNWSDGVKMRLRRLRSESLSPGAVVSGEVLIEADMAYEIDNMEGLAVRDGPEGETLITMIADDNFNTLLQRTVLLEFVLPPEKSERAASGDTTPKDAAAREP